MAAALPIYHSIRQIQVALSTNQAYKDSVVEESTYEKVGEALGFSGLNTFGIEKVRGIVQFSDYSSLPEQIAPVLGYMNDIGEFVLSPLEEGLDDDADTLLEEIAKVGIEGLEVVPVAREFAPKAKELLERDEQKLLELRGQYVTGGLVSGPEVPDTKENPADRVNPFTGSPYSDQMARLGLAEGGVPEGAVRIYDEDQGLKPVLPLIELFSGVGIMKGGRIIKEVGEEIVEKQSVPKILYHGSPKRGLSEIIPSKQLADNVNRQPGIFSNPSTKNVVKFTGNKGAVYSLDTSNISSFKNMLNISKNKVLNADNPSSSIIKSLDKEIIKAKSTPRKGLLRQDDLNVSTQLQQFKRDLLDKDNYVSGLGPAATNFLKKENVDIIKSTPNFRNPEKIPNYILLRDKIPVKDEFLTKLKNNKYYIQVD
tara:strand:- start:273 stop:1547 length:1275 start_codon:yes stop_codon:yes gene_type:complete